MPQEIDPAAQAAQLLDQARRLQIATRGMLATRSLLNTEVALGGANIEPVLDEVDATFLATAQMIGHAVGHDILEPSPPSAPTESVRERADVDSAAAEPLELPARGDQMREVNDDAEVDRRRVSVVLEDRDVVINDQRIEPSGIRQRSILHTLLKAGSDLLTAENIQLLVNLTTPANLTHVSKSLEIIQGFASKVNAKMGFKLITTRGTPERPLFGISRNIDLTYQSDVEAPLVTTRPPAIDSTGRVVGSLYDGLLDTKAAEPRPATENPIALRILTNNLLYVSDGREGHVISLRGHKLATFNALLTDNEMLNREGIVETVDGTGEGDNIPPTKISQYIMQLSAEFGQVNGRDVILRNSSPRGSLYGVNKDLVVVDERKIATNARPLDRSLRLGRGGPLERRITGPEQAGAGDRSLYTDYGAIISAAAELASSEMTVTPRMEEEAAVEDTGFTESEVVDALFLHRLSAETGLSFEPTQDMTISLTEHTRTVFNRLNMALQAMHVTNPTTRISEDKIIALVLGIPPKIPFTENLQITTPQGTTRPYAEVYETLRENGRGVQQINALLQSLPTSIQSVYKRALKDLREQFAQQT